jgi:hypothetical protein
MCREANVNSRELCYPMPKPRRGRLIPMRWTGRVLLQHSFATCAAPLCIGVCPTLNATARHYSYESSFLMGQLAPRTP